MATFEAQVGAWVNSVKGAAEAILKQSAQAVVNDAQTPTAQGGRMRVRTGFLRNSLLASTAGMPRINSAAKPKDGQTYPYDDSNIIATIAGAKIGESLYFGYTAAYAAFREYGARGQAPDAFVRTAAQKWPQIVASVEADLNSRLGY